MHDIFRIHRATVQDADIIAWHRARMFQDMGEVSDDAFEILRAKARVRLKEWLESGDYIGWLATPVDNPETIVGGAGVQVQPILPRPLDASTIGEGRQGTIVNVFTEPRRRRRGIADLLVKGTSLGRGTSRSTVCYFTRRTKAAQFTNGSDSSLARKCVSSASLNCSARASPISGFHLAYVITSFCSRRSLKSPGFSFSCGDRLTSRPRRL